MLRDDFIVGWKNIVKSDHVGYSRGYSPDQTAIETTNGAGAHNVQLLVLAPDRTVLHALPGYWDSDALAEELEFAKVMWRLWRDDERTVDQKRQLATTLQLREAQRLRNHRRNHSRWQGFDRAEEQKRAATAQRDTFYWTHDGQPAGLKSIDVLVHERLALRPFQRLNKFDVAAFADYGTLHYDNNRRVDEKAKQFGRLAVVRAKRARAARDEEKRRKAEERR